MDTTETKSTTLPSAGSFPAAHTLPSAAALAVSDSGDGDRNIVFTSLVSADNDITGLVAYSIYKQNKLDWLIAFTKAVGREPNEAELAAYIIGESTPRRLATYRHLAEATLSGRGPELPAAATARGAFANRAQHAATREVRAAGQPNVMTYLTIAAVILVLAIGVWLYTHGGLSPAR